MEHDTNPPIDSPNTGGAAPHAEVVSRFQSDYPRVGVIYNPRSRHNRHPAPSGGPDGGMVRWAQPASRSEIAPALAGFAEAGIDYLVINGGDGTVRDVLTEGAAVFGNDWPVLAVLPRGKTNALHVDLGAPGGWDLARAIAAYDDGRRIVRRPLAIRRLDGEGRTLFGFILGAGVYAMGIEAGQDAHRLGFFDSLGVAATAAFGIAQVLLGTNGNRWRRGSAMTIVPDKDAGPVPTAPGADPARRHLLLASTLQRMPLGLKLFGRGHRGIRLLVLDTPRRRVFAAAPAILAGWHPRWLAGAGLHHHAADAFELELGERFVLDGEMFPAGRYCVEQGPPLVFVTA